jgi:hypothetical protein
VRRRSRLGRTGRIFGIGLSRTATSTLTTALGELGFRALHFPIDETTRTEIIRSIADRRDVVRLSVLERVDALTDAPACACFEALDRAYPRSRFILTVREREAWLDSCRRYWTAGVEPFIRDHPANPLTGYIQAITEAVYGTAAFDRERFSAAHEAYHDRVRNHFAGRDDLLTLDICGGEGWESLCGFLGVPEPGIDFPWVANPPIET